MRDERPVKPNYFKNDKSDFELKPTGSYRVRQCGWYPINTKGPAQYRTREVCVCGKGEREGEGETSLT